MRQNALYAAAQIEERQGQKAQAHSDYERALGAAPEGALREEALVGSMESAAGARRRRARATAGAALSGEVSQRPAGRDGAATGGSRRAALRPATTGPVAALLAAPLAGIGARLPA